MEAIFLTDNPKKLKVVYKSVLERGLTDGFSDHLYTREQIQESPEIFEEVRFIFSTWNFPDFSEEDIKQFFPKLEAVFYAAGTVKYFAEPLLKFGVRVFSAAKANGIPVAENTVAQIVLSNKGYFQAQRAYRKPFWKLSFNKARTFVDSKSGNYKAKVGIIGAGAVGHHVIELLKQYDFDIYIHDPYISQAEVESMGVKNIDLNDLPNIGDQVTEEE